MVSAVELIHNVEFLADCDDEALSTFAARLRIEHHEAGELLIRAGEVGEHFAFLASGQASARRGGSHPMRMATLEAGSMFGELGLLADRPRSADVVALTPCITLWGDANTFTALLALPGVRERVADIVTRRLAQNTRPIEVPLGDGSVVGIRCLLPSDRAEFIDAVNHFSRESLQSRFFSGGPPPDSVIDYLLATNYVDHFAWIAIDTETERGIAVARFIRRSDQREHAEAAFAVADAHHGRGLATMLLGALGVAATEAGIHTFDAQVLASNVAMRRVLAKAGAVFRFCDAGVVETDFSVRDAAALFDPDRAAALAASVHAIVTASGLTVVRA